MVHTKEQERSTGRRIGRPSSLHRLFWTNRRASNAVEFSMLAPLLCLLIIGMLYAGLYLGLAHSLQQLSADTGRYAMVGLSTAERKLLAGRWIDQTAGNYLMIVPDHLTYETRESDGMLVVSLVYDISYLPPPVLLQKMFGLLPHIESSATVLVQ